MKPVRALLACSMLSALYFAACGSDDGKNIVRNTDGGAGGEAGEPTTPSAGAAGEPPVTNGGAPAEAGAGGVGGEGAVAPVGGEAGAGGEAPVCSGFVTPAEGGAGGEGAVVPLHFRCEDLEAAGAYYDVQSRKIVVPALPGMEGTVSGNFLLYATHALPENASATECSPGTVSAVEDELQLSSPVLDNPDVIDNLDYLELSQLTLQDACGNTAKLDSSWTNSTSEELCWYLHVESSDDLNTWAIDCYEGSGEICRTTCPTD